MIEWNIDPTLFTLGPLSPRWYGILFAMAFVISYRYMRIMFTDDSKPQKELDSLTITMIVGTILGARFGHVLFYEPQIFLDNPLEVFAIWHGGLASHGGALGIITGLWIFHKRNKGYSMIWLLDRLAVVAAVSGLCIRRPYRPTPRPTLRGSPLFGGLPLSLVAVQEARRLHASRKTHWLLHGDDLYRSLLYRVHQRASGSVRGGLADRHGTDPVHPLCYRRDLVPGEVFAIGENSVTVLMACFRSSAEAVALITAPAWYQWLS